MPQAPDERRHQIQNWLTERQRLTIEELAAHFDVSTMTIHRDVDALVQRGVAQKVHGGVVQVSAKPADVVGTCYLCNGHIEQRTAFVVQLAHGETISACCPHCGFLLLPEIEQPVSILVRDFLYGRVINAMQATYLIQSNVQLCCLPGVLCFTTEDDAQRFQRGFSGWSADFHAAAQFIVTQHRQVMR